MSIASWMAEFYPGDIERVVETELMAAEHCLHKWLGLRLGNLQRHGLRENSLRVDGSSCALCHRHAGDAAHTTRCDDCILTQLRGAACDGLYEGELETPYYCWTIVRDPEPMIHWLECAVAWLREVQEAKETSDEL